MTRQHVFSKCTGLGARSSNNYPAGLLDLLLFPEARKQCDPTTTSRDKTPPQYKHNATWYDTQPKHATPGHSTRQHHHETLPNNTTALKQHFASGKFCMHALPV